jgi:hypothetical protein
MQEGSFLHKRADMTFAMEYQRITRRSHQAAGIASFAIGVLSVAVLIGTFVFALVVQLKTGKPAEITDERALAFGLGLFSAVCFDLVGIGLGIAGAADRASKKVFPALGLVMNGGLMALLIVTIVLDPPNFG